MCAASARTTSSPQFIWNRTFESNSKYYDIHLPGEEREAERNFRLGPAYSREKDLGAFFGEKFGWERPNWYTPYEKKATHGYKPRGWAGIHWSPAVGYEHVQTRAAAGLFDESSFSKIEVRGPGALTFLQYLCDNDIDKPVGACIYTSMLNAARRHRVRFHGHAHGRRPLPDRHRHRLRPA